MNSNAAYQLEEAKALTAFLREATVFLLAREDIPINAFEVSRGGGLAFGLLQEKLNSIYGEGESHE